MAVIELDAIRVINLKHRTDRKEQISEEIQKAVDAGIFPDIEPEFVNRLSPDGGLVPPSFGKQSYYQTGCEHQRIMEELFQGKKNLSLILEDDAIWTDDFFNYFGDFWDEVQKFAPDWLALFLGGYDIVGRSNIPRSKHVTINNGSVNCHAYILNRAGLYRLYDHLFVDRQIIDWAYKSLMEHDKCCYSPKGNWFANQRASWSDNTKSCWGG